jgi:hypothetical protein
MHECRTVFLVEVDQYLSVGGAGESVSALLQPGAKLGVIVDLAVQDSEYRCSLVRERLMAAFDVDDAEAPSTQSDAMFAIEIGAFVIRTSVDERAIHRSDGVPSRIGR